MSTAKAENAGGELGGGSGPTGTNAGLTTGNNDGGNAGGAAGGEGDKGKEVPKLVPLAELLQERKERQRLETENKAFQTQREADEVAKLTDQERLKKENEKSQKLLAGYAEKEAKANALRDARISLEEGFTIEHKILDVEEAIAGLAYDPAKPDDLKKHVSRIVNMAKEAVGQGAKKGNVNSGTPPTNATDAANNKGQTTAFKRPTFEDLQRAKDSGDAEAYTKLQRAYFK